MSYFTCKKTQGDFKHHEKNFQTDMNNLFDIAHADAVERMEVEENKVFLQRQREPRHQSCLVGTDKKLTEREERAKEIGRK